MQPHKTLCAFKMLSNHTTAHGATTHATHFKALLTAKYKQTQHHQRTLSKPCNLLQRGSTTKQMKFRVTQKKTEPIQILLNLININRISRNLVDLNINLCTIIPQSFSYFGCFALKLCTV